MSCYFYKKPYLQKHIYPPKKSMFLRKFLITTLIGSTILLANQTHAYMFWFKSSDNTVENIQKIEQKYKVTIPVVSFIFDPFEPRVIDLINKLPNTLWDNRIYHITLSPNNFSASEVADGAFDSEYTQVFKAIKKNNLKVIFRTMHEMNGGRYPRSSNPSEFKRAWIHVRNMSRKLGLWTGDIQFDFSVNHRDMPTKETPSQTAKLIQCQQSAKAKLGCYTFEDYYPGDKYVDLVGFTFYNRGKGNSDRLRLTPYQIVNEKWRNTLDRIKKFNKPIVVDEVGTTAVRYDWAFNYKYSKEIYDKQYANKNKWLDQLKWLLQHEPSIVAAVYFNVDYTDWLSMRLIWEADWSVINLKKNKVYNSVFPLINEGENIKQRSDLANMFGVWGISINWVSKFLPVNNLASINRLRNSVNKIATWSADKYKAFMSLTGSKLDKLFPNLTGAKRDAIRQQASIFATPLAPKTLSWSSNKIKKK